MTAAPVKFGLRNHNATECTSKRLIGAPAHFDCRSQQNRLNSRSVSWSSTGAYLAMASSCSNVRIWTVDDIATTSTVATAGAGRNSPVPPSSSLSAKELMTVTGHSAPVLKVRFHPKEPFHLCSAAADATVQLWDIRGASQRSTGKIDIHAGQSAIAVEWMSSSGNNTSILQVTERDGTIYIYDVRKLSSPTSSSTTININNASRKTGGSHALHSFRMKQPHYIETCIFSPNGKNLVTGSTFRGEGIGEIRMWPWNCLAGNDGQKENKKRKLSEAKLNNKKKDDVIIVNMNHSSSSDGGPTLTDDITPHVYPAHAGPIYATAFSPDGQWMATGGCDATVGIWDAKTMCCTRSITRRTKFIRTVAFSPDSELLAIGTEEDTIDITHVPTGELVGLAHLNNQGGGNSGSGLRGVGGNRFDGAEEIAFHPTAKDKYILACARADTGPPNPPPLAPVTLLKLNIQ